jgi:hypothetical protein
MKSDLSSLGSADLRGENSLSPLRQIDFIEKKPLHPIVPLLKLNNQLENRQNLSNTMNKFEIGKILMSNGKQV